MFYFTWYFNTKIFGKDFFGFEGGMCFETILYNLISNFKEIRVQNSTYCQRFAGPFNQEFIAGSYLHFIGTIFLYFKFLKNLKEKSLHFLYV